MYMSLDGFKKILRIVYSIIDFLFSIQSYKVETQSKSLVIDFVLFFGFRFPF